MSRTVRSFIWLIVVLSLTACGGTSTGGKTYRVGIFASPAPNNFWSASSIATYWDLAVLAPTRLSLFSLTDQRFQVVPQIAADWASPLQAEGDRWVSTVPIKKGISWSDGQALTAKDVAFTYNTALRFNLMGGYWSIWADANYLERVEAPDEYTVRFIYRSKPGMARHEWGDLQAYIACERFWSPLVEEAAKPLVGLTHPAADAGDAEKEAYGAGLAQAAENLFAIAPQNEPVAGPFLFSRQEPGSFVENLANGKFFFRGAAVSEYSNGAYREEKSGAYDLQAYGTPAGDKTLAYTGGPNVAKTVYSVYSDQTAALLALRKGEIDFILNPQGLPRGLAESAEEDPNLNLIKNESVGFRFLAFNARRSPMADRAFRQAVATLIDREFLTATILQNVAFPVYSFVPEANAPWYNGGVPQWGFTAAGAPMTREERLNAAIGILQTAGYNWTDGRAPAWDAQQSVVVPGGTLVQPDGATVPELNLLAPTYGYDPLRANFAIWIAQWLGEAGIPVRTQLLGFNSLFERTVQQQDFDLSILGFQLGVFPSYLRDFWHSEQAQPGGKNIGGYLNPEFDQLSDQLLTCDSLAACKPVADRLQNIVATDAPWIALFDTGIYELYNKKLTYPYTQSFGGLQFLFGLPSLVSMD
jgi:peptide/nickel transport system substrate-binding protein